MQQSNLDFEIDVTAEQWAEICRTADALGPERGGFAWRNDHADEIRVFLRDEDEPDFSLGWVGDEDTYAPTRRGVAWLRYNDGRPYAHIELPNFATEPVLTEQEEATIRRELESWVRGKWHELLRESGLHYDRGHIPQS